MHANVHILSKEPLDDGKIYRIMTPYCEYDVPLNTYPEFTWDYLDIEEHYTIKNGQSPVPIENCYVLIDFDKNVIARRWWNGQTHIDKTDEFEAYIAANRFKWKNCHMYVLDIHW